MKKTIKIATIFVAIIIFMTGCSFNLFNKKGSNTQKSSSGLMTRTTEKGKSVVYYNENRYEEDTSAVFKVDDRQTDELIELDWFINLPFTMKSTYKSNIIDNPEFLYNVHSVVLLNDKIDFFKRTMVYKDVEGKTVLSFTFDEVIDKKINSLYDDNIICDFIFTMKDNPVICSHPTLICNNGDYYFQFANGNIATYKINPEYVDTFLAIAKK